MLVLLAAMTVAAATPAPDPHAAARPLPDARSVLIETNRAPGACKGAGRLQTSDAEPVLLLRPEDRARRYAYKLTDLPPGQRCLVEGADGATTSGGK